MESSPFRHPIRVYQVCPEEHAIGYHSLDMYTLEATPSGILWWIHDHTLAVCANRGMLQRRMYRLNKKEGCPTLQGVRHGSWLTCSHFHKLWLRGLIDFTRIKHKENYYVIS